MKAFILIITTIYLLLNSYIFVRGWQALPSSQACRSVYTVLYVTISLSFILAMLGRNSFPLELQKILFIVGCSWLACMLYFFLFFLFTDLIYLINKIFHFLPQAYSGNLFHRYQVILSSLIIFVMLLIGYYRFNHPVVENYDLQIHKKVSNQKTLRVVAISDIHLGLFIDKKRLAKYVEKINSLKPDIILIAGDLIDNSVRPLNEENMEEELNKLQAPMGVYMSLGNHEYISGINESLQFIKKTKIHLLKDEVANINELFFIVGRDDRSNQNRESLKGIIAGIDPDKPIILLDHQPYHLEEAEENKIDLQISGHTHDGQLWPANLLVKKLYEVGYGYKQKGKTHVYTSSGLALWGPPFRIGTQSEIVVFNLHFDE